MIKDTWFNNGCMHTRTFENMVATQATKIDISTILSGADGLEDS